MNRDILKNIVINGNIKWQKHALERMMERGISRETIKDVLINGEIIEEYSEDKPFPSALFLGWVENQPFHVIASLDILTGFCFVITAYKPDYEHFESDYKTRRKHEF